MPFVGGALALQPGAWCTAINTCCVWLCVHACMRKQATHRLAVVFSPCEAWGTCMCKSGTRDGRTLWPRQRRLLAVGHRQENQPGAAGSPLVVNGVQADVPAASAEDVDESAGTAPLALPTAINTAPAPEQHLDLSGGAEPAGGFNEAGPPGPAIWAPASTDSVAAAGGGGDMVFSRHRRGTFTCAADGSSAHKQHEHIFVAAPPVRLSRCRIFPMLTAGTVATA